MGTNKLDRFSIVAYFSNFFQFAGPFLLTSSFQAFQFTNPFFDTSATIVQAGWCALTVRNLLAQTWAYDFSLLLGNGAHREQM